MIQLQSILVLPLVHHLVQQRLQRLFPPVTADMATADGDLRRITGLGCGAVVAKVSSHPA